MKTPRKYLPIFDWPAGCDPETFDALAAASILGKRAGKDAMGGKA